MRELWKLAALLGAFGLLYLWPLGDVMPGAWLSAGFGLLHEYAREHVLTCLAPAFFIAGAMTVYLNKDAVLRYLGPAARAVVSYPLAGLSGGVLAVCSCTILPLFASIYKRGAGLGPAIVFVFTGPAINITAIFLTVSVLGWPFAAYRLGSALLIAMVAGAVMAALFESDTSARTMSWPTAQDDTPGYAGGKVGLFIGSQVGLLVVLGLGGLPGAVRWGVALVLLSGIAAMTFQVFSAQDRSAWMQETWFFTKQILPYLFIGVFLAGLLSVALPSDLVVRMVGGNGPAANAVASLSGALMYFATLTEIPIIESLMDLGMGNGPAMALMLTGNALSIPNLIVLNKILGPRRTVTYLGLTVSMSVVSGMLFGWLLS